MDFPLDGVERFCSEVQDDVLDNGLSFLLGFLRDSSETFESPIHGTIGGFDVGVLLGEDREDLFDGGDASSREDVFDGDCQGCGVGVVHG